MQFVLNDQVRRQERFGERLPSGVGVTRAEEAAILGIAVGTLHLTEQLSGLPFPRKARELIDRRDQEGRQAAIDGFIDRNDRQRRRRRKIRNPD